MEMFGCFDVLVLASGKPWMLQVCSRLYPPTLQQPPHDKEQQQGMLHNGKSHVGIGEQPRYGCKRDGKEVIICPLPMRQEIDDAMGEHPDKERERRSVEYSGQGEAWTDTWSLSLVPSAYRPLFLLNPLTGIVEGLRAVLVFGRAPEWDVVAVSAALTITLFVASLVLFKRVDKYFADVI